MTGKGTKGVLPGAFAILYYPELARCFGTCEALLIQQVHWYAQANGHLREGHYWMWNSVKEWENMLYMSRSTILRAISHLEELHILISGSFNKHQYDKTKWYRVNYAALSKAISTFYGEKYSIELDGPSVKMVLGGCQNEPMYGVKKKQPIPDITTEITTDKTLAQAEPSQTPTTNLTTEDTEVLPKNKVKISKGPTSATDVQKKLHSPAAVKNEVNATEMYKVWATTVPKHCSSVKFVGPFNMKEKGQMAQLVKHWGGDRATDCLEYVLSHWISFAKDVKDKTGAKGYPEVPTVDFVVKFKDFAMNYFLTRKKEPVQLAAQETSNPAPVPPVKKIGKITLKKGNYPDDSCVTLAAEPVATVEAPDKTPVKEVEDDDKPITLEELLAMSPFIKVK